MNEYMRMADRTYDLDNQFEQLKRKIEELEKENAGMKARLNAINLLTPELEKSSKLKEQQLTKAIELLKWALHSDPEHDDLVDFDTKWKEAEEFIKEIGK